MERGEIGALDYRMTFPSQQQAAAQTQQATPQYDDSFLPDDKDPLAVRGKLTADYYNNYALLQDVTKDMMAQGINPFAPDLSQQDGGLAHEIFGRAKAGVMYAANALKNELTAENGLRQPLAEGKIRANSDFNPNDANAYSNPNNFYSGDTLAGTKELNQRLSQETNTEPDQNRINAEIDSYFLKLDDAVNAGQISKDKADFEKSSVIKNVRRVSDYTLNPNNYRNKGSGDKEAYLNRAQLIKQIKSGIATNDQTGINLLRQSANVENARYINTGNKIGIEVKYKGNPNPVFFDLKSEDGAEGEINSMINRIEGQKNIPNEKVFQFDTNFELPESNAREELEKVKAAIKNLRSGKYQDENISLDSKGIKEYWGKLQTAFNSSRGEMKTPEGQDIESIEVDNQDDPKYILVNIYKMNGKGDGYAIATGSGEYKTTQKKIFLGGNSWFGSNAPTEEEVTYLDDLVEVNADKIAQKVGGGFKAKSTTTPVKSKATETQAEHDLRLIRERRNAKTQQK